jgi:hypothetical protein
MYWKSAQAGKRRDMVWPSDIKKLRISAEPSISIFVLIKFHSHKRIVVAGPFKALEVGQGFAFVQRADYQAVQGPDFIAADLYL